MVAAAIGAIVVHPSLFFGIGGSVYLVVGSVDAIVTRIRKRDELREYHRQAKAEAEARLARAREARAQRKG